MEYDTRYSGLISIEELGKIIRSMDGHPTKEEVADMINEVNVDGNGAIDFQDFLNIMGRKLKVINLLFIFIYGIQF